MVTITPESNVITDILKELAKLPEKVLESIGEPDLLPPTVVAGIVAEKAIHETIKVIEEHVTLNLEGTDETKNLSTAYWDMVNV